MPASANPTEQEIYEDVVKLLTPFNKKGIEITRKTDFSTDLDLDSLTVMDLVAAIEDHFDITIPLNDLPDLEKVGQVSERVEAILKEQNSEG